MGNGFNLSNNISYRLMQGRLGIYDKYHANTKIDSSIHGVQNQNTRLTYQGGSL